MSDVMSIRKQIFPPQFQLHRHEFGVDPLVGIFRAGNELSRHAGTNVELIRWVLLRISSEFRQVHFRRCRTLSHLVSSTIFESSSCSTYHPSYYSAEKKCI